MGLMGKTRRKISLSYSVRHEQLMTENIKKRCFISSRWEMLQIVWCLISRHLFWTNMNVSFSFESKRLMLSPARLWRNIPGEGQNARLWLEVGAHFTCKGLWSDQKGCLFSRVHWDYQVGNRRGKCDAILKIHVYRPLQNISWKKTSKSLFFNRGKHMKSEACPRERQHQTAADWAFTACGRPKHTVQASLWASVSSSEQWA